MLIWTVVQTWEELLETTPMEKIDLRPPPQFLSIEEEFVWYSEEFKKLQATVATPQVDQEPQQGTTVGCPGRRQP